MNGYTAHHRNHAIMKNDMAAQAFTQKPAPHAQTQRKNAGMTPDLGMALKPTGF